MKPYDIHVSPEGDHVTVTVPCDPLTRDHEVKVPFGQWWEAASVARSRQLGVDARGDL